MIRNATLGLIAALFCLVTSLPAAQFDVQKDKDGVTVKLDGKLLTRYLTKSGHKPIFWPVIGPYGNEITRSYPMTPPKPDERKDHVHHRSFWFTHGDVNGVDFWSEGDKSGHINHREFVKLAGGKTAVIITRNDWVTPAGKKVCQDERSFTFGSDGNAWWVDCDIVVKATEGEVKFGDTKEGSFGVRVAGTMKLDSPGKGTIVNSEGQTDKATWGKRAAWVDYSGPLEGHVVGVAILNHPSSFRHPTYWHAVRSYGLFCANPFGLHNFVGPDANGAHTLGKGESFTLRHRVLFHQGDAQQAKVAKSYADYANQSK